MNISSGTETQSRDRVWLFVILLAALAANLFFLRFEKIITPDEGYYLRMGQHLHAGGKYGDFDFKPTKHKGQPLVPYLFSFSPATGRALIAQGRGISMSAGLFTLILFYACARFFMKSREALISTSLLALSPFYIQASIWAMTHSFLMLFLMAGLYFSLQLEIKKARAAVFTGALFWAAYMVRVEAVLFVLAFSLGLFLFNEKGGWAKLKAPLLILLTFFILCLPVWKRIHQETGVWHLTWTQGLGVGDILEWRWSMMKIPEATGGAHFLLYYLRFLKTAFFQLPGILPLPFWILSALGTGEILTRRPDLASPFWRLLLFALIPFGIYPALAALDPRFFYPVLMFALMPAGAGLTPLKKITSVLLGPVSRAKIFQKIPGRIWLFGAAVVCFVPAYANLVTGYRQEPQEQKEIGEWLARHRSSPYAMLGSDQRACFYAGRACLKFIPIGHALAALREKEESLEDFFKRSGIFVIAYDTRYGKKRHPEFQSMLQGLSRARLRQAAQTSYQGEEITLYDWLPELHDPQPT